MNSFFLFHSFPPNNKKKKLNFVSRFLARGRREMGEEGDGGGGLAILLLELEKVVPRQ